MSGQKKFSVGICAFNEAQNIGNLIEAINNQSLKDEYQLNEIIVVASGCTDNTVDVVKKAQKEDKKIKLIEQKKREGKARAVNLFLQNARSEVLFLQSADTIPHKDCYNHILEELNDNRVGLVAGRVIPKDPRDTFMGALNHIKWDLHHKINLSYPIRPKVGELIAFKKMFERIPPETAVDEASIEPLIHLQGFKISYVPEAIIFNKGPETVREYLSGRRRIYAGHYLTKKKYAYEVVTFSGLRVLPLFLKHLELSPKHMLKYLSIAFLEVVARTVGYIDIRFKLRDHTIWKNVDTSKNLD